MEKLSLKNRYSRLNVARKIRQQVAIPACLVLGSTFRLHHLGDKASLRTGPALDESLGFVYKCVRQRVRANVADRERFPLALQHKIDPAAQVTNTSYCHGAADAHALAHCRA